MSVADIHHDKLSRRRRLRRQYRIRGIHCGRSGHSQSYRDVLHRNAPRQVTGDYQELLLCVSNINVQLFRSRVQASSQRDLRAGFGCVWVITKETIWMTWSLHDREDSGGSFNHSLPRTIAVGLDPEQHASRLTQATFFLLFVYAMGRLLA